MNNKGQIGGGELGIIISIAIAIIVGVVLLVPAAQSVGGITTLYESDNVTFAMPANGTTSDLTPCGQQNTSLVTIWNATHGTLNVTSGNYSVEQGIGTSGYLATRINCDGLTTNYYCGYTVNVSCDYQPVGYIADSGGRAIAGMITIFFALAVLVVAMVPTLKNKVLDMVN